VVDYERRNGVRGSRLLIDRLFFDRERREEMFKRYVTK